MAVPPLPSSSPLVAQAQFLQSAAGSASRSSELQNSGPVEPPARDRVQQPKKERFWVPQKAAPKTENANVLPKNWDLVCWRCFQLHFGRWSRKPRHQQSENAVEGLGYFCLFHGSLFFFIFCLVLIFNQDSITPNCHFPWHLPSSPEANRSSCEKRGRGSAATSAGMGGARANLRRCQHLF